MASELEARIIQDFAEEIAGKLNEAAINARTASAFGADGLPDHAFRTLLDIETLFHDASILLNATSVVCRRDRQLMAD